MTENKTHNAPRTIRLPFDEMRAVFRRILLKKGFSREDAATCARVFAENSRDGVFSHGANRFPMFIEWIERGLVKVDAKAEKLRGFGAWEVWDGNLGPGILNALACTDRAMELAREYGLGCVGLQNTNHWQRGGTYGWRAAEAGFAFVCWTNTIPNMPAWGARSANTGNNPLVLAVPRADGPVVLDIAMSQFSFGKLETLRRRGGALPVPGGFDAAGHLTDDPAAILETQRALPMGYWKGSGLSIVLDLMAAALSGGKASHQIGGQGVEYGVSQVFLAFDVTAGGGARPVCRLVDEALAFLKSAEPAEAGGEIRYPGEGVLRARRDSMENGVPVNEALWRQIQAL